MRGGHFSVAIVNRGMVYCHKKKLPGGFPEKRKKQSEMEEERSMKKMLSILLILCVIFSLAGTASAAAPKDYLTLSRGKTIKLWAYPFENRESVFLDKDDYNANPDTGIKYIKLKSVSGTPKAEVTSGGSWLSASIKSNKVTISIKGSNTKNSDQIGKIRISDKKGTYGTIVVRRGGLNSFTSIRQVKGGIELKLKYADSAYESGFIFVKVLDKKGQQVELEDEYVTNRLPLMGKTTFVDSITEVKAGYTYIYYLGYIPRCFNSGNATSVAVIKITNANGSAKGKTKSYANHAYTWDIEKALSLLK